jgi:hypothetical protein
MKRIGNKKIFIFVLLLAASEIFAGEDTFLFNCGEIPFGKSVEEVLELVKSENITSNIPYFANNNAYIYDYSIFKELEISSITEIEEAVFLTMNYLNPELVTRYIVEYSKKNGIARVYLFFYTDLDNDSKHLFLVEKSLSYNPDLSYKNMYELNKKEITTAMQLNPEQYSFPRTEQYIYPFMPDNGDTEYEVFINMSIWESDDQVIFLHNMNYGQEIDSLSEISYFDKNGWNN